MIILPTTEVRQKMGELIKRITDTQESCIITQRGHAVAVLMDIDRYQAIMDELEDVALENDIHLSQRINEARANYARGEGLPLRGFLAKENNEP